MSKYRRVAAAAVAAALLAVSACSSSSGSEGGKADSITIWHNAADPQAITNLYQNFTKATGIKVNLVPFAADGFETAVQTKWATGDRPDILEYHPTTSAAAQLNAKQNMQDLSKLSFVGKSGDLYKMAGSYNGTVYAAITGLPSIFGVFYNKAAFKKAGVAVPQNFDQLLTACGSLKAAGVTPWYESGQSLWPTQILPANFIADQNVGAAYSDKLRTNKQAITDPSGPLMQALKAYEKVRDACFQKNYATGTFEKGIAQVYGGQAAMIGLHSDTYNLWQDAAGGDETKLAAAVGFTGISATSPKTWFGPGPLGSYYAPKTGDNGREAAAIKFIDYATGAGYQQLLDDNKAFPVIDGFKTPTGISPLKQQFKDAYDHGSTIGFATDVIGFGDVFPTQMGKLLNKQATPEDVAKTVEANVKRASKAAGVDGW
ncbi:ABC transporter substrate-binding protein [Kribbella speibonae]|uniref:Extracellular solute-binding protein n=1 Tax=Kribbella speibonae TaxID=1572660 RepID=A0A4R0ITE5_9ACTN|nr:extracellular solute-binding protein [Kribbella speibonae]TCC36479.1 extracellular solute-binding protein [Kribbella speibonae]